MASLATPLYLRMSTVIELILGGADITKILPGEGVKNYGKGLKKNYMILILKRFAVLLTH